MSASVPTSVLAMNDTPGSDVQGEEDAVSETTNRTAVTYTIKVLSEGSATRRKVLFRRTSGGQSIEISAETDAPNLLAALPQLLEAALETQRALWPRQQTAANLPAGFFPRFADEVRRLRWLTSGPRPAARRRGGGDDAPRPRGALARGERGRRRR
jgi:hypothetical protein